jgi:hypothetical protein
MKQIKTYQHGTTSKQLDSDPDPHKGEKLDPDPIPYHSETQPCFKKYLTS